MRQEMTKNGGVFWGGQGPEGDVVPYMEWNRNEYLLSEICGGGVGVLL
jgi:hypothetical protein